MKKILLIILVLSFFVFLPDVFAQGWWNENWNNRKLWNISEINGISRTLEFVEDNIPVIVSNCFNEIRVACLQDENTTVGNEEEIKDMDVIGGDNANWCVIVARLNISANSWRYCYVYYNNPLSINPNYIDYTYWNGTATDNFDDETVNTTLIKSMFGATPTESGGKLVLNNAGTATGIWFDTNNSYPLFEIDVFNQGGGRKVVALINDTVTWYQWNEIINFYANDYCRCIFEMDSTMICGCKGDTTTACFNRIITGVTTDVWWRFSAILYPNKTFAVWLNDTAVWSCDTTNNSQSGFPKDNKRVRPFLAVGTVSGHQFDNFRAINHYSSEGNLIKNLGPEETIPGPSTTTTTTSTATSTTTTIIPVWWNENFQYRRGITINNMQNPNELMDYQVPINLTYSSNMQSDFSDIRFTWYNTSNGHEIEIPYWIENQSNSEWAYVWTKVKEVPASSCATVYVYYGNITPVNSVSNGTETFVFFDDFETNIDWTNKWMSAYPDKYSIENGKLKCAETNLYLIQTQQRFSNVIAEASIRDDSGLAPFNFEYDSIRSTQTDVFWLDWPNNQLRFDIGGTYYRPSYTPNLNDSFRFKYYLPSYGNVNQEIWLYGHLEGSFSGIPAYRLVHIGFAVINGQYEYVDWVFVHNFTDPKPTYSIGSEETRICYSDINCDDSNECTIDTCVNPGTGESYCFYTNVPDGTNCIGNPGKCCSGICDNNGMTHGQCTNILEQPYCLSPGEWGRTPQNQGFQCGNPYNFQCFSPLTCEEGHYYYYTCDSGYCNGTTLDIEDNSACNNFDCGTCCKCSVETRTYDETQDSDCSATSCPDGCDIDINPFTWDYANDVLNYCQTLDACTSNSCNYNHVCADSFDTDNIFNWESIIRTCGAECDENSDCRYCENNTRYYSDCDLISTCACYPSNSENCANYNGCYVYETGCEEREYYCTPTECEYNYTNRNIDYNENFVDYCYLDTVRKHRQFHDFYCGSNCTDHISWVDDQLVEDCGSDGWYNTSSTRWVFNDSCTDKEQIKQEYRDNYCGEFPLAHCNYTVNKTRWFDTGKFIHRAFGTQCGDYEICQSDRCNGFIAEFYPEGEGYDYCDVSGNCIDICAKENSYCTDNDPFDGINSLECGAECDQDTDCSPNTCSETYYDYCVDKKLTEYDDDKILDNTIVEDFCDNTCKGDCTCSDCPVDCSSPQTNTYCVKNICGAECDSDDDCPSDKTCIANCTCRDITPPTITIVSPENKTYNTVNVTLNFTVDEPTSWIGYSLNNTPNITILGPLNLTGMANGWNNIIIFASDESGNVGSSEKRYFFYCLADTNQDKKIDLKDVFFVGQKFGSICEDGKYNVTADLNDDCKIDLKDYYTVTRNYGKTCS